MRATFNHIAPVYDTLAFTVFGNNLLRAKKQFLHELPEHGRLLLIGGGTGTILNELCKSRGGIIIDFVEASDRMLNLAREKTDLQFINRVNFINGDHHAIPPGINYDAVTTFFVLDCMKQDTASEFSYTISKSLKKNGLWLFADFFRTKNIFQRMLLWMMYCFFRFTAGIEATRLPDYDLIFDRLSYQEMEHAEFLHGFIRSKVYKKVL